MIQALVRMAAGAVYALFGAEALAWFSRHGMEYTLGMLALMGMTALVATWWAGRWFLRLAGGIGQAFILLRFGPGRRALWWARLIRKRQKSLLRVLRKGAPQSSDSEQLTLRMRQFIRQELPAVLEQLQVLGKPGLRTQIAAQQKQLDAATEQWAALPDGPERERLQRHCADLRQNLQRAKQRWNRSQYLVEGLERVAQSLDDLAVELTGLGEQIHQPLPQILTELDGATDRIRRLNSAYRTLEGSPPPSH